MGPVGGDAVLHSCGFEIPTGRRPLHRIVDSLPFRVVIGQAMASTVEVAPSAPLHSLVVLCHVHIHLAPVPQGPDDLWPMLSEFLVTGRRPGTLAGRVLIGDPDGRVTTDPWDGVQLADPPRHTASPFDVRRVVVI